MQLPCFILWAVMLAQSAEVAAVDVLLLNSSLTSSSAFLSSPSSSFILSLRPASPSTPHLLYLAISFSIDPSGHPAWVANRDNPVSPSATLTLSASGNLLLSDTLHSPPLVWSSDTANKGIVQAQLLDSGNLVLLTSTSGSDYVWQSFDSPSNTLLAGQNLTNLSKPVLSCKRSSDFGSGIYSLAFSPLGVLELSYTHINKTLVYWSWPESSKARPASAFRFDDSGRMRMYDSASSITFERYSYDFGSLSTRRVTLDTDGNLRMYRWDAASLWSIVWQAFTDGCSRVANVCGDYGICSNEPQPTCLCPPEFSPIDSTDLSAGCRADHPAHCSSSTYVEMIDLNFPYNDIIAVSGITMEDCKQQCTNYNCSCAGAVYGVRDGEGVCWLKHGMRNGQRNAGQSRNFVFLRVSQSDQSAPITVTATNWITNQTLLQANGMAPSPSQIKQPLPATAYRTAKPLNSKIEIISVALAIVIAAPVLCLAATFMALSRKHRQTLRYIKLQSHWGDVVGSPRVFTYEELAEVTKKFSFMLGEGAFGKVFRGQLADGKMVAVKHLKGDPLRAQEKQFKAEIATIGRIHHINLLGLVGFCAEDSHRLLVYEYMERGSLDTVLFQDGETSRQIGVLEWDTRFQICLGIARGIHYLHEACADRILHCDIKPANILLDEHYCAKVADFGLAFLYSRDHTVRMSTVRGTRGYLAPEWISNLRITTKADVYSYGMLVMEILSGRKNHMYTSSTMMSDDDKWYFPLWAYGKRAVEVVDARVERSSINWEEADLLLKVAYACIQADMNMRPHMVKVVQMLEGTVPTPPLPPLSSLGVENERTVMESSNIIPMAA